MEMNMNRDGFIKKKFQEDNYISDKANNVFDNFMKSIVNNQTNMKNDGITNNQTNMNNYNFAQNQFNKEEKAIKQNPVNMNIQGNLQNTNNNITSFTNYKNIQNNNAVQEKYNKSNYNQNTNNSNVTQFSSANSIDSENLFYKKMNRFLSVAAVFLCAVVVGTGTVLYNRKPQIENVDITTKSISVRNEELKFSSEQVTKFYENDLVRVSLIGNRDVAVQLKSKLIDIYDLNLSPYKQYKVNGIVKDVDDVFVGNVGNENTPIVFLLMADGTVEYVNIIDDKFDSKSSYEFDFSSQGRIAGLYSVVGFEQSSRNFSYSNDKYYFVYAIKDDGKKKEIDVGYYNDWNSTTTYMYDELNQKYIDKHDEEVKKINEKKSKENLKDSFKVTYETKGVRNLSVGGVNFVCNEEVPIITGIDSKAAEKMEKYLTDWYNEVWNEINSKTPDEEILEILSQMHANELNYPNLAVYDIGFNQSYEVDFINNKVVTFKHRLDGGIGGVSWGNESGVSFNIVTGDVVKLKDIITSKQGYINACKKYVMEQLKADSRYENVVEHNPNYESVINEAIEKLDGYFVSEGIVCVEIPKYELSSGADGEFRYAIPYNLVKDYIDSEYVF